MKLFLRSAFYLFFVFAVGAATVWADENPIDFKQSKNAWVVWMEYLNGENQILAAQWQADHWSKPSVVSAASGNMAPSVAVDPAGNPWVVWSRYQGAGNTIYLSRFDGKEWSAEQELSTENLRENVTPVIAIHSNGKAVVAWGSDVPDSSEIHAREWSGENWGAIQALTDEDTLVDVYPAVSFDQNGNAFVVWSGWDASYTLRLAGAWQQAEGKWAKEKQVELGGTEFGEEFPTLKLEGEALKLYCEDANRFFASEWNGKNWTAKKLVDLNSSFYEVFKGLEGNPGGRAWFAWTNQKGKANSFRYNIISHDVVIVGQKGARTFPYFSYYRNKMLDQAVNVLAWVLGEQEAYAKGKKKKGSFKGPMLLFSDSFGTGVPDSAVAMNRNKGLLEKAVSVFAWLVLGEKEAYASSLGPIANWTGFYRTDADFHNDSASGRTVLSSIGKAGTLIGGIKRAILALGTNDLGHGASLSAIESAYKAILFDKWGGLEKVHIIEVMPRTDGHKDRSISLNKGPIASLGVSVAKIGDLFLPHLGDWTYPAPDDPSHLKPKTPGAKSYAGAVKKAT